MSAKKPKRSKSVAGCQAEYGGGREILSDRRPMNKGSEGVGHPVNPITGIKFLSGDEDLDFVLAGALPLPWQRRYYSDRSGDGWLGRGWSLPFSSCLKRIGNALLLIDAQGNETALPALGPGESRTLRDLGVHVRCEANGRYRLISADHSTHHVYAPLAADEADPQGKLAGELPLVCIADRYGRHIRVLYNERGLPVRIHDAAARMLKLEHIEWTHAGGERIRRLRRVVLGARVLVSYEYSDEGDLVGVRDAEGRHKRAYRYHHHLLTEHSQPGGLVGRYEYDRYSPQGKVVRSEDNLVQVWQFRYLPGRTEVSDALGQTTIYLYNEMNALVGFVDAAGNMTRTDVDGKGNRVRVTDAAGRVRLATYDAWGNMTSLTDAAGGRREIQYDPQWQRPTFIRDAMGMTTRLEYDAMGNLGRRTDEAGHTTEYAYDAAGQLIGITDAHGRQQHFGRDDRGQVTSHTDCAGRTTRYSWDEWGHLASATNAAGETTRYGWDHRGLLLRIARADGSSESWTYDVHGRLVGHVDALGARTQWQLAADGLPVARIDALGHRASFAYDALRRLCTLTNENGAHYRFAYDAAGRLVEEQGFDGRLIRYRYDASGLLEEKLELGTQEDRNHAETIRTTYERDRAGQEVAETIARAGDAKAERSTWRYDAAGRLLEAGNDCCRVERGYDALGRLVREVSHVAGQTLELRYAHDAVGNHIATTLPDKRCINYLYYGPGWVHQINVDGEVISDIERDELHREVSRTQGQLITRYRYDRAGRLAAQSVYDRLASVDAAPLMSRSYRYDPVGNVIEIAASHEGVRQYRYDALGQLVGADREVFAFDPAHNPLDNAEAPPIRNNQLEQFRDWVYSYDTHGNLAEKARGKRSRFRFDYSLKHRVERVHIVRDGHSQQVEYGYDALGRRVCKKDDSGTTLFLWEANRLLGEIHGDCTRVHLYRHNSFVPLAQIETTGDGLKRTAIRHYHADQIGLPRELTDEQGCVQWRADYGAWGSTRNEENAGAVHQPMRFQGQYCDAETKLHYNQHRYYDPETGRFVTQDPAGLRGDINLYRYAPNPNGWIDPLGLQGVDINIHFPGADRDVANNIPNDPNIFSVAGHGYCDYPAMQAGSGRTVHPAEMAQRIRQHPKYRDGMPVQVYACYAGAGENCFAQQLANELQTTVYGPNNRIRPVGGVAENIGAWVGFRPQH